MIVHEAEKGGLWAEVPALPVCASQGDTLDELLADVPQPAPGSRERLLGLAV